MNESKKGLKFLKEITGCGKMCSSCKKKDNPTLVGRSGKAFTKPECFLAHVLTKFGIAYEDHWKMVAPCAFNADSARESDFYLPEYDLYIEVKGTMTLFEHNKLSWLVEESGEKVYVFVDDNEDWDGLCDTRLETATQKKRFILEKQIKELKALKSGALKVDDLVNLSKLRLNEYAITRSADKIRWNKKIIEQKCDGVELETE